MEELSKGTLKAVRGRVRVFSPWKGKGYILKLLIGTGSGVE